MRTLHGSANQACNVSFRLAEVTRSDDTKRVSDILRTPYGLVRVLAWTATTLAATSVQFQKDLISEKGKKKVSRKRKDAWHIYSDARRASKRHLTRSRGDTHAATFPALAHNALCVGRPRN